MLCHPVSAIASDIERLEIRNVFPKSSKDKLYCSVDTFSFTKKIEVLVYKKSGSKFTSYTRYLKSKALSSATKAALRKKERRASIECDRFKDSLTTSRSPQPTPTYSTPLPTITPTNIANTPTPLPTLTPTTQPTTLFRIASQSSAVFPKRSSDNDSIVDSNVSIECTGCNEDFSIEVGSFSPSLFESASTSLITSLVEGSNIGGQNPTREISTSISVALKPYVVGTGLVSLRARYKGQLFTVNGDVSFSTQGDSLTYPAGIFVSRTIGSDSPTQPASATAPVASFAEAMNRALSQLYSATGSPKNIVILLGDGVHLVDSTISINQSRLRQNDSLTIMPWDNSKPVLFLGREIPANSWSIDPQGRWKSCYVGAPTVSPDYLSSTVYRNLEPLVPARFPNSGMLTTFPLYENDGITRKTDRFTFNESGLPTLAGASPVEVTFVDQYLTYKSSASITGKTITVTSPAYQGKFYSRDNERHEFYIEGPKDLIDGQVTSAAGDVAYEFAQESGCIYHNHLLFDPSVDTIRYANPTHSGLLRIYQGTETSGAIGIYGVQLTGGALAKQAGNSGPNWGNPQTNHSLLVLEAASNIKVADSFFGPSGMAGIIGYRDVGNISISGNVFKNISGPSMSIVGYDFRPEASVQNILIENNAFVHPNPALLMNRGISLGNVGASIIRNNYFKDLYQSSISVAGLRYYYNALTWCQRVECPRFLNKQSCTVTEQSQVCQCSGGSCANIRKLSWDDAQDYNPTRNIVIQGNFVEGGLAPVNDAGLIYVWGIPYGDSSSSTSCTEDPSGCKSTTNVNVIENVTLNKKELTGANHFVHYYADDGANSTDFKRNIAINPAGSAILLFSKGQGGTIADNLLIGSDKSSHAMIDFAEFDATSNPATAPFLSSNKELNRKKVLQGNAFLQLASNGTAPPSERGSLMFFSNWDPTTDDGYGKVLQSSSGNIFSETAYGKASRKAVFLRLPTPELLLTVAQWKSYVFSQGRVFDSDSTAPQLQMPSSEQLASGILPGGAELSSLRSKLPEKAGVIRPLSRYDAEVSLGRSSITLQ